MENIDNTNLHSALAHAVFKISIKMNCLEIESLCHRIIVYYYEKEYSRKMYLLEKIK